jgi:hypothetical protein
VGGVEHLNGIIRRKKKTGDKERERKEEGRKKEGEE